MKKLIVLSLAAFLTGNTAYCQFLNKMKDKVKNSVDRRIDNRENRAIDNGLDKTENGIDKAAKGEPGSNTQNSNAGTNTSSKTNSGTANTGSMKTYQNYDFVPGSTIVFEDHFEDDMDGEFPAHWNLGAGQAVLNNVKGTRSLLLTDGNYAHVIPLIKNKQYLTDTFTIEFDNYWNGGYPPKLYFYASATDAATAQNQLGSINMNGGATMVSNAGVELSGTFPAKKGDGNSDEKWHHIAIAYKAKQLKVYIDEYRVLVVPNSGIAPRAFDIEGIGGQEQPIVIANMRVANGGGMNMLGKKFTETKIVTHGINFDINKATIKPESMGTLNGIVQIMKDNPEVKFEVGGHTDSDGGDAINQPLSQQRADAVRTQLIGMGIPAVRLTAKGFGASKPISDNKSLEGKANNRRVEFVKI